MILSFGWTWPAFVARAKSCTRRIWTPSYLARWQGLFGPFQAYAQSPRFGGKCVGHGRVRGGIGVEDLSAMPDADYEAEGFAWFHAHPHLIPKAGRKMFNTCARQDFDRWRQEGGQVCVVRFDIIDVADWAEKWLNDALAQEQQQDPRQERATRC